MSKAAAGALKTQIVRLVVPAGKATAAPPVGPALGARGVKSIDFVKEFNGLYLFLPSHLNDPHDPSFLPTARTTHLTPGTPTPVLITISPDRTFTFQIKSPPTSYLIKQATGLTSGSGETPKVMVGKISVKMVYEIAKIKKEYGEDLGLRGVSLESVAKSVAGSCKSMGVEVVH